MFSKSSILALFALASISLAAPMTQQEQFNDPNYIAETAGGAPPNGGPPASISDNAVTSFQAVNFLENLESAFFLAGLNNLTNSWNGEHKYNEIIKVVEKVHAQELVHVETAENILKHFNKPTFGPCKYQFPVSTAKEFLQLADIITSVGIGGVINVASGLALSDPNLVPGPASILAVEARHDAFFRTVGSNLVPNPAPFDTRISAAYALNLAAPFIVPGSCASMPKFQSLPSMKAIVPMNKDVTGSSGPIKFSLSTTDAPKLPSDKSTKLYIGWVNQANTIAYTEAKLTDSHTIESSIAANLAGVAFAALTTQNTAKDVNALTAETIAGPAPVKIS